MADGFNTKMLAFTIDCKDPHALGKFYAALLKWEMGSSDEEYVWVYAPGTSQGTYPYLLCQRNPDYVPPVWPDKPGAQQQMAHLDIAVDNLEQSVQHALQCGATVAGEQFSKDWTVMLDPDGHPFCLCLMKHLFAEEK